MPCFHILRLAGFIGVFTRDSIHEGVSDSTHGSRLSELAKKDGECSEASSQESFVHQLLICSPIFFLLFGGLDKSTSPSESKMLGTDFDTHFFTANLKIRHSYTSMARA